MRQYLPKNERLDTVTQERVDEIENLLDNRPRKVLQFRTPIEVFNQRRIESALSHFEVEKANIYFTMLETY